jgi:MGT family glycosyltransferase
MKILAYTTPARGHLFPLVPILDELASRGHELAVRTLASQVGLLRARGVAASSIAPEIEAIEHDDHLGKGSRQKLERGMATFARRAPLEAADLAQAIGEERPDLVLADCMAWGASAQAEAWGGPWAQWFPYPLPLSSRDAPPFGPGLKPAAGPLGRLRDRLMAPMVRSAMEKASLPGLNQVRAHLGVPPFEGADDFFTSPPLLLYMTAEPFEYPRRDWPESVRMIGPCAWDPPAEEPEWLAGIDRPLVLVSTSSEFQDDGVLARTALDALAGEDVFVVATSPSAELPDSVPENARVESFVPHGPVLKRAACAITHGGAGVTQKALSNGVPVCVVPFGRDQLEVARRVEVAGAGTRLPARRLNAERLRDAVLGAMRMTDGARAVAAGFAAAGGPKAGADALEALAGGLTRQMAGIHAS